MVCRIHILGSSINEHHASITVGFVQLASNIASLFIVDRSGRKPLLIISALLMCISTASMGVAFYLNAHGVHEYGCVFFTLLDLLFSLQTLTLFLI